MARPLRSVSRNGRSDFAIVGPGERELQELGRLLKATGDKELFKKTQKALADGTQPAKDEVRRSALETLPQRGGLAAYIADLKVVSRVRTSGRNVGVRLTSTKAKGAHTAHRKRQAKARLKAAGRKQVIDEATVFGNGLIDLDALNRGKGKHPTWGRRPWVLQDIKPGFWTKAMTGPVAHNVRIELLRMIDGLKRELAAKHGRGAA